MESGREGWDELEGGFMMDTVQIRMAAVDAASRVWNAQSRADPREVIRIAGIIARWIDTGEEDGG